MTRMSAAGKARGLRDEKAPTRFSIERTVIGKLRAWKLEEAKARFSEVVRRAREQGPQRVTYHGKDAVVVIAVDDLKRLLPAERPRRSIVDFLQETALGEIDVRREPDRGRDVAV